ncbi:putative zinc-binding protein [Microtetraspora niveoalba]|uniref:putative zinc-binding protein n=1 Tax=Microtetraspora niveoalba TaxID=46175 RepID=UPI00082E7DF7|nr:putative zinc-binding protein [Microtetraspora niveoalba]
MTRSKRAELPLVYSCSGCSSAAQMANDLALRLDREGHAEMSCIAGVGGDVGSLVRVATSGRPIVALDGCPLTCVLSTLRRHGVVPDEHVRLDMYGVRKRKHADYDREHAERLLPVVVEAAEQAASRRAWGRPVQDPPAPPTAPAPAPVSAPPLTPAPAPAPVTSSSPALTAASPSTSAPLSASGAKGGSALSEGARH